MESGRLLQVLLLCLAAAAASLAAAAAAEVAYELNAVDHIQQQHTIT